VTPLLLTQLGAWAVLSSAWAFAQAGATEVGLVEVWWHRLLAVVLFCAPGVFLAPWWLSVPLSLPLAVAAAAAWPMALASVRRTRAHAEAQERADEGMHATPAQVQRERERASELRHCRAQTLEIVSKMRRPAPREAS
jgi:membrane protein implicated in regulation of membrane protease activity